MKLETRNLKLLLFTAHPDDEAGSFGGTLLSYAERGVETHVICLTPGQAGSHRGNARTAEELAALRRKEFAASCELLRVAHAEVLDYPDGGLPQVNFASVVGDLTRRIRNIRPQVIMTYGPEGSVTAHPDHGMAGVLATAAFHAAPRTDLRSELGPPDPERKSFRQPELSAKLAGTHPHQVQKLYYVSALVSMPGRQPVAMAPVSCVLDVKRYFPTKIAAFRKHTTQAPLFELFEKRVAGLDGKECFHLVASSTPRTIAMEEDLFAGVT